MRPLIQPTINQLAATFAAILFLFMYSGDTWADMPRTLKVGVKVSEPFVSESNGVYSGEALDIWEQTYTGATDYTEYATVDELINAVSRGEVDVAVGAISMTSERETKVDFLHPFYKTGLSYVSQQRSSILDVFLSVIPTVAFGIGVIFIVNALAGMLFAYLEHEANETVESKWTSIFTGVYWSSATLTTVGYGDVSAETPLGRIFATIWMWSGLVITGMMMALVVSAVSVNHNSVADFNLLKSDIGVVDGSAALHYTSNVVKSPNVHTFKSLDDAISALEKGKVDGVIHDKALLDHMIGTNEELVVSQDLFNEDYYAFAVQDNSDMLELLNQRLLVSKEL